MGDLSFEYQDSVIAANYIDENDKTKNAREIILSKPNAQIEDIEKHLQAKGIEGSTYHFDNGNLTIFVR